MSNTAECRSLVSSIDHPIGERRGNDGGSAPAMLSLSLHFCLLARMQVVTRKAFYAPYAMVVNTSSIEGDPSFSYINLGSKRL